MDDSLGVNETESIDDLVEELLGLFFGQFLLLFEISQEVSIGSVLHNKTDVVFVLKNLEDFDDIWMAQEHL